MAPERTGMRNSALASAAALTSVALFGQSTGAAQADEGPSREEVSRRVSSLYDRAETDTGTFNATRASATGPRKRAGGPAASGRDGDRGRGAAPLDDVARQWFDVARSKLGPTMPATLPKDRMPERPAAPARGARPSGGGEGAREISGRTALELPAGSGAPVAELTSGASRSATVGELTAGPVAALPAGGEAGGALALPAAPVAPAVQSEVDQRASLRTTKERSQRKLSQARELLSAYTGRSLAAIEAPAAAVPAAAAAPASAQNQWDALEAQSPADLTTVPPGSTAWAGQPSETSASAAYLTATPVAGSELGASQGYGVPDAGFSATAAGQTGSFPAVDQTGSFPVVDRTGSFPVVDQTAGFPMVDQSGSFPMVSQTGSFPAVGQTGSFPAVDQSGSYPAVAQTGGFPAVDQTGSYPAVAQTGGFPAVDQTGSYPAVAPTPAAPQDSRALRALEFARGQIGKPCVWGTTGPNTYDGPGLTQAAWKAAGIALPRTAQEQATAGQGVALTDLEPGDLVLYHAGHVGICSGNGMMIHAPGPGTVIREESIHYAGEDAIHSAIRPA
ncbi:C40 family peptidase [Streptomyces sp. FB2]|uniref:C40 family peptidase n=1 Tax=Streptomyces sp. FB2 TaxID=2902454 RepID=UPI001F1A33CF|nr:NlpC/P60 family protein [Streptomyces sp. FB2]MCF2534881.1 C40 family peptidase [Streptomyces sp. FB2]